MRDRSVLGLTPSSRAAPDSPSITPWVRPSVVVISSTIVRGAMTAVTWLSPPVYPLAHAADLDTAVDIVQRALEGDGRNAPAELVALRNSTT